jgi:hypothetical protein
VTQITDIKAQVSSFGVPVLDINNPRFNDLSNLNITLQVLRSSVGNG